MRVKGVKTYENAHKELNGIKIKGYDTHRQSVTRHISHGLIRGDVRVQSPLISAFSDTW
jgi:hypothetical protein